MALVTKQQIYESIIARLEGGSPGAGKKFERRMVYSFMQQSINAKLKLGYMKEVLNQDETIPEGMVIACYDNIPVAKYKKKLSRAILPAMPVSLRRTMGVYFVGPAADGNIVIIDPATLDKYIIAEYVIGGVSRIVGNTNPITGVVAGSSAIVCDDFVGMNIRIDRGHVYIPSIDPLDGSNYFSFAGNTIALSSPLAPGEYIRIEAYTSLTQIEKESMVIVESVIGVSVVLSGSAVVVAGLASGSLIVSCTGFIGKEVSIIRGNFPVPGINPGDGSTFYTKVLDSELITLSTPLSLNEYIKIQTF